MKNRFSVILFDLDGTLLNSFSAHYKAYEAMFARFGIPISKKGFLKAYSPDWYRTYEAFGLPRKSWRLANRYWLEEVEKRPSSPFPKIKETLQLLNGSYALGIVTSGSKQRVVQDLARSRLDRLFHVVVTGEDITHPKPHPEGLLKALTHLSVTRREALYVGDADADFEMARAAGVEFVCVKSRFAHLPLEGPFATISSIRDLPILLSAR